MVVAGMQQLLSIGRSDRGDVFIKHGGAGQHVKGAG